MKKTHKKVFGLFGLVIVAAVTVFAAFLPNPTKATTSTVTDTIKVRVVGSTPAISADGIEYGDVLSNGTQTITIPYENIDRLNIDVKYVDADGNEHNFNLLNVPVGYVAGEMSLTINFLTGEYTYTYTKYDEETDQPITVTVPAEGESTPIMDYYGHGEYTFSITGIGYDDVPTETIDVPFEISPVGSGTGIVVEDDNGTDRYYLEVDYTGSESETPGPGEVAWMEVDVYKGTGDNKEKVDIQPPLIIYAPANRIEIPFEELGLDDGDYTIEVTAYDRDGNLIYKKPAFSFVYTYDSGKLPPAKTANTGGMMGNLNISKTDYIITGLIVFGIVGISGAVFISRHDKKASSRRRK